jgi:uncharacterized protein YoxC
MLMENMNIDWEIIVTVAVALIVFVVFLIRKNLKDEKEVTEYFLREAEDVEEESPELNDER